MTRLHLEGLSFRALARHFDVSVGTAYNCVSKELEHLAHCADVTREHCQKFSGILEVDGKYISVKPLQRKMVVLYGVDYTTHDIPHFVLAKSESYAVCKKFFASLNLMGYPLMVTVSDDNRNIYETAPHSFPAVVTQLCHVHFLRSMRLNLEPQHNSIHLQFLRDVKQLFLVKRSEQDFDTRARKLLLMYQEYRELTEIMLNIAHRKEHLLGYLKRKGVPVTTNLVESYNSQLQARLASIKGFESTQHAQLWLNAYFLKRRTQKLTDCTGKFKKLNGTSSLELSKKPNTDLPVFL